METVLTVLWWTFGVAFLTGIVWALAFAEKYGNRPVHPDSKPGSYYFESHKKGGK